MAVNLLPANVPIGYVNNDLNQPIYASPELTRALTNMMLQIGGQTSAGPGDVTNLTAVGIEHGIRISGTLPTPTPDDIEVWSSADNVLAHAVLQTHGLLSSWDWIGLTSADGIKYIWVRTVFKSGKKGNFVGPVSAEAGINAVPGSVTGLTATPIIGGIRITATLPSDLDLAGAEIWENTVSNVNTATMLDHGLASSYDRLNLLPSAGTRYYWVRCYNTSGARGAFVGPVSGVAGQVQSGNIASGAVAVAAFASGIEPVTIVSSVPSVKSTNSIFNTTDGKLYRWIGGAYTKLVTSGDIAANAVTAGTIAANAVTAGTIAAGAVSASQISVSQLSAITADMGTITAGTLSAGTLVAGDISVNGTSGVNFKNGTTTVAQMKLDASGYLLIQGSVANKQIRLFGPTSGGIAVDDFTTVGQTLLKLFRPGATNPDGTLMTDGTNVSLISTGMGMNIQVGTLGANTLNISAGAFTFGGSAKLVTATSALAAGNASGNVPVSNGTVNTNLNADMVDGHHSSDFALQTAVAKALVYQTTVTPSSTAIAGYIKVVSEDGTIGPVAMPFCNLP
jgi:hypothetical protein